MKLQEIKNLTTIHSNELIESLRLFVQNKEIRLLTKSDIVDGLKDYFLVELYDFWRSQLTLENIILFVINENKEVKELALDFLKNQEEWIHIKAEYDVDQKKLKIHNPTIGEILSRLNISWHQEEINMLKEQAKLLDETVGEISVVLRPISLSLGIIEIPKKEEVIPSWIREKISKPILATTMLAAIFLAHPVKAEDQSKDAIKVATDQVLTQTGYGDKLKKYSKKVGKQIKSDLENTNLEYPAYLIAYGLKVVTDGGVEIKGKADIINYELNLNPQDSYIKLSQEQKNTEYFFKTTSSSVEVGLSYEW